MSTSQNETTLPKEILDAAARGWRLLPVLARGKKPLLKDWQKAATSNLGRVSAWAAKFPECNWGVATGSDSGVVVVDIDGEKGRKSMAALEMQGLVLPATLTVITGRPDGGEHRYYRTPAGVSLHNDQNGKIGSHIDVRGEGGQAVIPPSTHATGTKYRLLDPDTPIAELPAWALDRLTTRARTSTLRVSQVKPIIVKVGERTKLLVSIAGAMNRRGERLDSIIAALQLANNTRCSPPLVEPKVVKIAADIVARYAPGEPAKGYFFGIDSNIWARVTDFNLNEAVAYLVLACGTGHGNRTTGWSTNSVMTYAGLGWIRAKAAVEQLIAGGFLRCSAAHTASMPQYELATYRELVEHETKKNQPPPLSRAERGILANLQAGRQPTQKADRARAEQLRKRGLVRVDSQGCYDLLDPVEEGSGCNFIWLPNEIVTGASLEQESPVRLLRSLGSVRPVRLFVNFYNAQNLRDDGGVDPRLIHQKFDRKMICERGAFTIWGFRPTSLSIRWTGLLAAPGSEAKEAPEENSTELDSLNLLLEMNLLSFVPHIYENDTDSAEPIHAFGIGGVSEDPLERNIGDAAQSAARACAPTQRLREAEKAGFNYFCPIPRSKPAAQMIGVARLPHRPQTRRTQAWSQHLRETTPRWIDFFENSVKSDERTVFQMPAKLA